MTTTEKMTAKVTSVNAAGAMVSLCGEASQKITWPDLQTAAAETDDVGQIYRAILRDASRMDLTGPLTVSVVPCESGVGHCVLVTTQRGVMVRDGMRADDGMDHHGGGLGVHGRPDALAEAKTIGARLVAAGRMDGIALAGIR